MRKIGVIDIGTNTVRAVGYNVGIEPICEKVFESNILKHTKDGVLSFVGIKELNMIIKNEIQFFNENGISEIYAFATSAMRDVNNFDEVKEYCEIEIELLSEEDEALCDFYALKNELGEVSSGVGIDLGGGSCQIIAFNEGRVEYFSSFPIGVKRLYNKFGKYNSQKKNEILKYIKTVVGDVPKSNCLYVMGGTGKKIRSILKTGEFFANQLDNDALFDESYQDKYSVINTIPYGALVIKCIAFDKIKIMDCGSRDGFVIQKLH